MRPPQPPGPIRTNWSASLATPYNAGSRGDRPLLPAPPSDVAVLRGQLRAAKAQLEQATQLRRIEDRRRELRQAAIVELAAKLGRLKAEQATLSASQAMS